MELEEHDVLKHELEDTAADEVSVYKSSYMNVINIRCIPYSIGGHNLDIVNG